MGLPRAMADWIVGQGDAGSVGNPSGVGFVRPCLMLVDGRLDVASRGDCGGYLAHLGESPATRWRRPAFTSSTGPAEFFAKAPMLGATTGNPATRQALSV
jgi:hypothetical protein